MAKQGKKGVDFKALALAHFEKAILAVALLSVALLIWKSFGQEGLPAGIAPEDIQQTANAAQQNITHTKWEDYTAKPAINDISQKSMTRIEETWYLHNPRILLDPPEFAPLVRRGDPSLLPPRELEVQYDAAPLAMLTPDATRSKFNREYPDYAFPAGLQAELDNAPNKPPKAAGASNPRAANREASAGVVVEDDEVAEGRRWVMLFALAPIGDQTTEYYRTFADKVGYDRTFDVPQYAGYEVERADVTDGGDPDFKPLMTVSERTLDAATYRWKGKKTEEIIDRRYVHPVLTWPLANRALKGWGESAKHSKVSFPAARKEPTEKRPAFGGDPLGGGAFNSPQKQDGSEEQKSDEAAYRMVRFYDFDVEPGRRYQYRVRLVLFDPNYIRLVKKKDEDPRVPVKILTAEVVQRLEQEQARLQAKGLSPEAIASSLQYAYSPWSPPSPVIRIPRDMHILAKGAVAAERPTDQPEAAVVVKKYDPARGIMTQGESAGLERSSIVNFNAAVTIREPNWLTQETINDYPFNTDNVVVDIQGGGEIVEDSPFQRPAEILVYDPSTDRLVLHQEIEDAAELKADGGAPGGADAGGDIDPTKPPGGRAKGEDILIGP